MPQQKYYAVHNGREGTQIYLTWDEAKVNVNRVSGVIYKSFRLPGEAQAWLQGIADAIPPRGPLTQQNPNQPVQRAPPATHAAAGPSQAGPSHVLEIDDDDDDLVEHDAMEVDDSSDIEILDGPPPHFAQASRARPSAYRQPAPPADDDDGSSDIEILEGPPPNFSRTASAARSPAPKQEEDRQRTPAVNLPQQAQVQAQAQAEMPNGAHAHDAEEDPAPTAPAGMLEAGPVRDFQLSPDQLYVLSKVKNGESVFFTGSAGTGKSVLLREIIKACGGRPSMKLAVTASTGIASVNIGGCTLHSWAGIQLGKEDKEVLVGKILGLERKAYKVDQERRKQLWARKARGEQLSGEDEAFLKTDPKDTAKSKYLKRWQQVKTLIIDESAC
ncbi:PIF1-like helicase-domain-containing protein [Earliella scabrosa]|nr:PIF1-like helicase-domain-containing protein [Earliella scabrosa]